MNTMKTMRYTVTKKYKEFEAEIGITVSDTQMRFIIRNSYIGNIRYIKYKDVNGCSVNDKVGYAFYMHINDTKYKYTFDTAEQAIARAENMFDITIPNDAKDTFLANQFLFKLANKIE